MVVNQVLNFEKLIEGNEITINRAVELACSKKPKYTHVIFKDEPIFRVTVAAGMAHAWCQKHVQQSPGSPLQSR